jgi:hypothetical protein
LEGEERETVTITETETKIGTEPEKPSGPTVTATPTPTVIVQRKKEVITSGKGHGAHPGNPLGGFGNSLGGPLGGSGGSGGNKGGGGENKGEEIFPIKTSSHSGKGSHPLIPPEKAMSPGAASFTGKVEMGRRL